jgi:hypothetical protein
MMQILRRLAAKPFGLSSDELAVTMAVSSLNCSPSGRPDCRSSPDLRIERGGRHRQAGE